MKKIKTLLTLGAASLLLIGCGGTPSADSKASNNSTSEATTSQTSSAAASSSSKSSAASKSSSARAVPSTISVTQKADVDYKIFNKAPEIKFVTDEGADLTWATRYGKDDEKPEVSGWLTTSKFGDVEGFKNEPAAMKVRGNWTSSYQKKPFRIKFGSKRNLFGLNNGNKYKKWVLLADVKDSSMLRNVTAFYLAKHIMPDSVFVPDFTPVHLYLNDQYWGMYILTEQKEVGEGRVNLPAVKGTDTSKEIGYFFELDNYYSEEAAKGEAGDPTFTVNYQPNEITWHHNFENYNGIQHGYTISSDISNRSVQVPYVKSRVEMAYTVIYNAVMNNRFQRIENDQIVNDNSSTMEECLAKTIDIDSFVGMYLLHDIVVDPDIGYSSFYFSLDMSPNGDHLLRLNNPWDFDSTLGVRMSNEQVKGQSVSQEAQDIIEGKGAYASKSSNMWLSLMWKAPFFQQKVKAKYDAIKAQGIFTKANAMLDDYSSTYTSDYSKNFQKWTQHIGRNPEVAHETLPTVNNFRTEAEAKNYLKNWLNTRVTNVEDLLNGGNGNASGGGSSTPNKDEFKANANKTRLEAENATLTNGNGASAIQVKTRSGEGISGNSYVGNMDGNTGAKMTWTFNNTASTAKQVYFVAGLSARTSDRTFAGMFNFTVNGQAVNVENNTIPGGTGDDYHMWTSVDVGFHTINPGNNTIVLESTGSCTNFDYLDIYVAK